MSVGVIGTIAPDVRRAFRAASPTAVREAAARFGPVLERLAAEDVEPLDGRARLEAVDYRERPFSHVLRVAVSTDDGRGPRTHLFVKIFKAAPSDVSRIRERVSRDFATMRTVRATLSPWPDLRVVRPVACYPEHLASVTEEAPGRTLGEQLHAVASWTARRGSVDRFATALERVGRWVHAFQAALPAQGRLSVDGLAEYVDIRLARLVSAPAARFGPDDRRRVLAHLARLGAAVAPVDLEAVKIHADFAPGNILAAADSVTVLDLAMSKTGSRLHDLSRLWLQIELMGLKPQLRRPILRNLALSVLRGYDPALDSRRAMFRLLLMQHRVNHLATLSTVPARFPVSAYNWHIRRDHRSWIARELRDSEGGR